MEIPPPEQAAQTTTDIPRVNCVTKPVDLPEPLKTTAELLAPPQETAELTKATPCTQLQVPEQHQTADEAPLDEYPEPEKQIEISDIEEESPWLPTSSHTITEELPEPTTHEADVPVPTKTDEPEPEETTEPLESEAELISAVEQPALGPAEETGPAEALQDTG